MTEDQEFILQELKERDRGRYLSCLYLPEEIRFDIATLWAFDAEISAISDRVSEPLPGEIRLQWWRDLLKSGDNVDAGPLARNLLSVIEKRGLSPEGFYTYLDAKIFDLYQDPMPNQGSFEGYLGETVSIFYQAAGVIAGSDYSTELANASGHAGMASGMATLLANVAKHRARGQLFFPKEMLASAGFSEEISKAWLSENLTEAHLSLIENGTEIANDHLTLARQSLNALELPVRKAFMPIALSEALLKKVKGQRNTVFQNPVRLSPLRMNFAVFLSALRKTP